jgi:selenocysteine lyase/cysteine desulfurase
MESQVKKAFAQLINAKPEEISYVQSTQVAENLVLAGLELNKASDNIVSEALHYRGSIYLYGEMAKRGFDVRIVRPRDNEIKLEDLAKAIDSQTKLVSISLVSYLNGFQHDLRAVCDIAHNKGALVYADIVQAAGAVPIDVRSSGVDFCACSGYKWLMGDKGLGFLYVRSNLLDSRVQRTQYGGEQLDSYMDHVFATDPPLGAPASWKVASDAGGHFEVGAVADIVIASLCDPLEFLNGQRVKKIQEERRPLIQKLMEEMPKLGYPCLTPTSNTPIVSFAIQNREALEARMKSRSISVAFIEHTMRVSPSIYNSEEDIDRLLDALHS